MRAFVAVTDKDWYQFLAGRPGLDEVNFWQPGGNRVFRTLKPGEPLLFKLHYPDNAIVGGGFLAHASLIEASVAWDAFGVKNGAPSYPEMRRRIERYRRAPADPHATYQIGCIILVEPFFWPPIDWIPAPEDFSRALAPRFSGRDCKDSGRWLGSGFEKSLFQWFGQVDCDEAIRRVPVVLATLVHDSNISVSSRFCVGDQAIDFASLEGGLVTFVLDTNCKANARTGLSSHWSSLGAET